MKMTRLSGFAILVIFLTIIFSASAIAASGVDQKVSEIQTKCGELSELQKQTQQKMEAIKQELANLRIWINRRR